MPRARKTPSTADITTTTKSCRPSRPPSKFTCAEDVVWANFAPSPPGFVKGNLRATGRRREGMLYEQKVHTYLEKAVAGRGDELPLLTYIRSPWICFRLMKDKPELIRFCQPDALIVDIEKKHVDIIEVKLQHTSDAWWQVRKLYEPVLRVIYPYYTTSAIEIVRWLDPQVAFPETFCYASNVFDYDKHKFGVHIYYPSRSRGNLL